MKFTDLELHPDLMRAIEDMGFTDLTPIQEKSLEPALAGRDIAGISQTGSGKTVAFMLPILQRIMTSEHEAPAALVVAPTRELCLQIAEETERLMKYNPVQVCAIYGGESYDKQEARLRENPAIIAATPGRLIDYLRQGKIKLSTLQVLVLDEADRMFDMGFIRDIRLIMRAAPKDVQTMLYSATLSYYVIRLAGDYMEDPVEVRIESESVAVEQIDQRLYHLGRDEKGNYLVNQILQSESPRAIVFTNLKMMVTNIVTKLRRYGIRAVGISSLLDQKKRVRLLKDFKLGKYSVLVATDVASRGLDVDDVTHVFNYDLPMDAESYVHRIGRTARAGKSGISISYCSESDYDALPKIERYLGQKVPVVAIDEELLKPPRGDFEAFEDANHQANDRGGRDSFRRDGGRGRNDRSRRRESGGAGRPGPREPRPAEDRTEAAGEASAARSGGRRRRRGGRGGGEGATDRSPERAPSAVSAVRGDPADVTELGREARQDSIRGADRAALLSRRPNESRPDAPRASESAQEGGRRRRRRRRGGQGRSGASEGDQVKRIRRDSGAGEAGRPSGGGKRRRRGGGGRGGADAGKKAQPAAKKGLVSRLLSVFKRK